MPCLDNNDFRYSSGPKKITLLVPSFRGNHRDPPLAALAVLDAGTMASSPIRSFKIVRMIN